MTPRSSGPGGEYAPLRGTTNLRLTANQYCKCNGKLRWRSCGHHFPSQPGRGSATDCLGHSRKADLVNFSQASKVLGTAALIRPGFSSINWRMTDGSGQYHSLQTRFERRLRSAQILVSYTWGHAIS